MEPTRSSTPVENSDARNIPLLSAHTPVPVPPPVVPPVLVPPPVITTSSVFETKPGRSREKKPVPVKSILFSLCFLFLILIVALYFWGAHLSTQSI